MTMTQPFGYWRSRRTLTNGLAQAYPGRQHQLVPNLCVAGATPTVLTARGTVIGDGRAAPPGVATSVPAADQAPTGVPDVTRRSPFSETVNME